MPPAADTPHSRARRQLAMLLLACAPLLPAALQAQDACDGVAPAAYRHVRVGENLAAGQDSIAGAVHAWEASASHYRTLIDPGFTETALACAIGLDGEPFWVLLPARPL